MREQLENGVGLRRFLTVAAATAIASCTRVTSRSGGRAISRLELLPRRRLAALHTADSETESESDMLAAREISRAGARSLVPCAFVRRLRLAGEATPA